LALEVSDLIEAIDPIIEMATSAVCPDCTSVCCINRHSYLTDDDIFDIHALGKKISSYKKGIKDEEPCQFLGELGCTISRPLRPYRCTWYFCTPLLEHFKAGPAVDYRIFIALLEKLTLKRKDMLDKLPLSAIKRNSPKRLCTSVCMYWHPQY
jgi:hypothetical protein